MICVVVYCVMMWSVVSVALSNPVKTSFSYECVHIVPPSDFLEGILIGQQPTPSSVRSLQGLSHIKHGASSDPWEDFSHTTDAQ